ncbi:hypothetical protein [Yinghuangia soli]|uniref:LGFP repeat-containing protein n=1 Tax=Yinghuangia soli TaxID=2908204 RepID=A0AA41PYW8_9ACTN|nr:hypothetical protein [Yinghuangia soli]MCF2528221.1 hypothetical protein [Yinghuangia soli]
MRISTTSSARLRKSVALACTVTALTGGIAALAQPAGAAPSAAPKLAPQSRADIAPAAADPAPAAAALSAPEGAPALPQAAAAAPRISVALEADASGIHAAHIGWQSDLDVTIDKWRVSAADAAGQTFRPVATAPFTGATTVVPLTLQGTDVSLTVEALSETGEVLDQVFLLGDLALVRKYVSAGGAARFGDKLWDVRNYIGTTWGFAKGEIWWTTGGREAYAVPAEVAQKYKALTLNEREGLGSPVGDPVAGPGGKGSVQYFSGGAIVLSPDRAAVVVLDTRYRVLGGPSGVLGFPLADRTTDPAVPTHQRFERGTIVVGNTHQPTILFGGIHAKWLELGGVKNPALAKPQSGEKKTPDGQGVYVEFDSGWRIYWSAATNAHAVDPVSYAKWQSAGGSGGYLGYPVTDSLGTGNPGEYFIHFQRGTVFPGQNYSPQGPARIPYIVFGGVRGVWAATGWAGGGLGEPIMDERTLPDGVGRYQEFRNGTVYWNPRTGAHWMDHYTRRKWEATGGGTSFLGYPIASQRTTADGRATVVDFQGGSIYVWPIHIVELHGGIRAHYAAMGAENSKLGLPTSDEEWWDGARVNHFEHGFIKWDPRTGKTTAAIYPF